MQNLKNTALISIIFSFVLFQNARAQQGSEALDNQESEPSFNQQSEPPPPDRAPPSQPEPRESPADSEARPRTEPAPDFRETKPEENDDGFEMPSFSIRLDPLNWLIEGRLGLELEIAVWKFISFEMVPVFVVNDEPPIFNFAGEPDNLTQHSNGLGPISGSSFGLGFWLSGKALQGTVLRLIYTNYGYTYKTDGGLLDEVDFTERRLYGMIGSISRWGIFTIASGFGIGVELNQRQRCYENTTPPDGQTSGCEDDEEQHIAVDRDSDGITVYDLNGWLHPIYLTVRIALGITLDFD
ncbi:MAG: hypothetical protein JXA30_06300 [Deltaproteobacteria bacterium]|nr:hypothetical protein [Deltaproteobacteria bacterium]